MKTNFRNDPARMPGLLLLLVLLAAAAGCGAPVEPEEAAADLRIAVTGGLEAVPLIAALETGIFSEKGVLVDLEAVDERCGPEIHLQSGAVDGFLGSLFSVIQLQQQGFMVMAVSDSGANYLLVGSSRSEVFLVEDMAGKTVALSENLSEQYLLEILLSKYGLEPGGVELLVGKHPESAMEALLRGEADAALLPRPLADRALRSGARYLASTLDEGLPGGVIVFSGEALQEQEELIGRFYDAYREAAGTVNRGEYDVRTVLVEKWGYPEWWLNQKPEKLSGPRPVDRDVVKDAVAWFRSREPLEPAPVFEGLVWLPQLGE